MRKFKIGDKIMGIATDMLRIRIVSGNIIDIIEPDPVLYKPTRLIIDKGKILGNDTIYEVEATEYNSCELKQAEVFYDEASRLENKAKELREMARTEIYSKNTK
jgi:hypothetical protein